MRSRSAGARASRPAVPHECRSAAPPVPAVRSGSRVPTHRHHGRPRAGGPLGACRAGEKPHPVADAGPARRAEGTGDFPAGQLDRAEPGRALPSSPKTLATSSRTCDSPSGAKARSRRCLSWCPPAARARSRQPGLIRESGRQFGFRRHRADAGFRHRGVTSGIGPGGAFTAPGCV